MSTAIAGRYVFAVRLSTSVASTHPPLSVAPTRRHFGCWSSKVRHDFDRHQHFSSWQNIVASINFSSFQAVSIKFSNFPVRPARSIQSFPRVLTRSVGSDLKSLNTWSLTINSTISSSSPVDTSHVIFWCHRDSFLLKKNIIVTHMCPWLSWLNCAIVHFNFDLPDFWALQCSRFRFVFSKFKSDSIWLCAVNFVIISQFLPFRVNNWSPRARL